VRALVFPGVTRVQPQVRDALGEAIGGVLQQELDATFALWTRTSSTNPCVSTSKWRFLPFTFFPPS
jgi:uncharacterized protein YfaS (alpha-2-macroglobulin family)